jgi:hypothetical protein
MRPAGAPLAGGIVTAGAAPPVQPPKCCRASSVAFARLRLPTKTMALVPGFQ